MHDKRMIVIPVLLIVILVLAGGWYLSTQNQTAEADTGLSSSGTVEAVEVTVAPEVSGRVVEVLAEEGQVVETGQALFRLDGSLLTAQRSQAETALASAKTGVDVAQTAIDVASAALDSAQTQYDLELANARLQEQPQRTSAWSAIQPSEFVLPAWYFTRAEALSAAQSEMQAASDDLETEKANYAELTGKSEFTELSAAEERLALAQQDFLVAQAVLNLAQAQNQRDMRDEAQSAFDSAKAEVEAAQEDYNALLSEEQAADILQGRAKLAVAQQRYDTAVDRYNALLTGEDSLRVQAASKALKQADTNLAQAESKLAQAQAAVDQAQAQIDLIDVQIEKLTVYAAVSGVVLSRSIEAGEVVSVGSAAMTIGQLDQLSITVYVPEDRYGEILLGQGAEVTVDSFPNQTFQATVVRIADQAEFTPRNVQTDEGRRTTVFAVKLMVEDPAGKLKPGMPADVVFDGR
jgi:multidrug resistance efflux pump